MIFAVDLSKDRTVQLIADEVEVTENGFGGQIVTFYRYMDDLNAKDDNGHVYAKFNNRAIVGSCYLDKIKCYRVVSGISDDEFEILNREGLFASLGYMAEESGEDGLEEITT